MPQDSDFSDDVVKEKPFPLRKFAVIAGICTIMGYFLVFLPLLTPYTSLGFFALPGLILSFLGLGMLVAAMVIYSRRRQGTSKSWSMTYSAIRGGSNVIILGMIALIMARMIQPLVWSVPSILTSQSSASLIQNISFTIIGGAFWGFTIGYYFVRYSNKIPLRNPVHRALVVSLLSGFILNALGTVLHLNDVLTFYLWATVYSMPSYVVLGLVLGYSYQKFNSERAIRSHQARPVNRRSKLYYYLILFAIVGAVLVASNLQSSLAPTSFTATDIHFDSSNGIIHITANITNPSQPSIIQVNAAINGMDDGICGYGINTNTTMACIFSSPNGGVPLLYCGQLLSSQNYTLTLNAYFSNMKTVINKYTISSSQIGCSAFKL